MAKILCSKHFQTPLASRNADVLWNQLFPDNSAALDAIKYKYKRFMRLGKKCLKMVQL